MLKSLLWITLLFFSVFDVFAITNDTEALKMINLSISSTGFILGLILCLFIKAIFLNYKKRSPIIETYIGLLVISGLSIKGLTSNHFLPNLESLQTLLTPTLMLLTLFFSVRLTKIQIYKEIVNYPVIQKIFFWLSFISFISACLLITLPFDIAVISSILLISIALIFTLSSIIFLWIKSRKVPIFLLKIWAIFIVLFSVKTMPFGNITDPSLNNLVLGTFIFSLFLILWGINVFNQYISDNEQKLIGANSLVNELTEKLVIQNALVLNNEQEQLDMEALVDDRTFELNVTLRELQETNRKLQEQATNDALTGVKNRKFFDERLKAEYRLSRRQHTPVSLLVLDADKFKLVNDNYGHLVGDEVLIAIAKIASGLLKRPNDYVCRYGGEEFAILLSNTDEKGAFKIAELIRQHIADKNIQTESVELKVTVSIGISTLMIDENISNSQLFDQADKALYYAKNSGRNIVKTFTELQISQTK